MYISVKHFLDKADADLFLRNSKELQNAELLTEM